MIANTPKPPYYAVVFTSVLSKKNTEYDKMAAKMNLLAKEQDGFLGVETAREGVGITVSYWKNRTAIKKWKAHLAHSEARKKGKEEWYKLFKVRVCKVESDYSFEKLNK